MQRVRERVVDLMAVVVEYWAKPFNRYTAVVVVIACIGHDGHGLRKYTAHHLDLMCAFGNRLLVDADIVNPQVDNGVLGSETVVNAMLTTKAYAITPTF
jgi:hypothetical protein